MEYLQINKYRIRIETNTTTRFNLFEIGKTKKGEDKETIVAYAITLARAIEIISHDESAKVDVKGLDELITWQTKKYEALASQLTDIGKLLWDKLYSDIPKREQPEWLKRKKNE